MVDSFDNFPTEKDWLEDSRSGRFSRYAYGVENSVWVCNNCSSLKAHPHEGCPDCDAEPED